MESQEENLKILLAKIKQEKKDRQLAKIKKESEEQIIIELEKAELESHSCDCCGSCSPDCLELKHFASIGAAGSSVAIVFCGAAILLYFILWIPGSLVVKLGVKPKTVRIGIAI